MSIRLAKFRGIILTFLFAVSLILTLGSNPGIAADPFRGSNTHKIGTNTEAAFKALFQEGNYQQAKNYLLAANESETSEPLAYALQASLAYMENDWDNLKNYGDKTLETAKVLATSDPLRGYLYTAVGNFLEGTYIFYQDGPIGAISKLQQVFQYLDAAEKKAPQDPELNLIKGYMDLLLAVNLPFSSLDQAIQRLEDYAAPKYLVDRGIAIAYRDLKKYDRALNFAERSLTATPDNPEIYYLKAQILYQKSKPDQDRILLQQSIDNFEQALEKAPQLPESIVKQIEREHQLAQQRLANLQESAEKG